MSATRETALQAILDRITDACTPGRESPAAAEAWARAYRDLYFVSYSPPSYKFVGFDFGCVFQETA